MVWVIDLSLSPQTKGTMSYEILYRTLFVKIGEDMFIPMIEAGSSNVFDIDNKRARDWQAYQHIAPKGYASEADMIAATMKESDGYKDRHEDYDPNSFGYFASLAIYGKSCGGTSLNSVINIIKNGCKNAIPIERLGDEHGIFVTFRPSAYSKEDKDRIELLGVKTEIAKSRTDYIYLLKRMDENRSKGVHVWITLTGQIEKYFADKKQRNREKYYEARRVRIKNSEVQTTYVIKFGSSYVVRIGGRRVRHTNGSSVYCKDIARRYTTLASANRAADRLRKSFPSVPINVEERVPTVAVN